MEHEDYMREALSLAREAAQEGEVPVGCVIVKDGEIIGRGRNRREELQRTSSHAEMDAIAQANERLRSWRLDGCALYVTLEPCSHWGRTPPCALAIVEHRIGRVVTSVADPNPQVAGRGLKMIRDAGIEVTEGVRSKEGWLSNRGFLTRMTTGRPWVRMKCAATLDGRTAFPDGRSQWITGPAAREDSQYWRAVSGAVVTGIGTVLAVWLYWNFCGWLNILNCTLPPVGIILVLGYFLNKEKYQDVEVSENVNWFAVLGVVLGAVVANLVHWGIASINGMVVAAVCYLIGRAVEKK